MRSRAEGVAGDAAAAVADGSGTGGEAGAVAGVAGCGVDASGQGAGEHGRSAGLRTCAGGACRAQPGTAGAQQGRGGWAPPVSGSGHLPPVHERAQGRGRGVVAGPGPGKAMVEAGSGVCGAGQRVWPGTRQLRSPMAAAREEKQGRPRASLGVAWTRPDKARASMAVAQGCGHARAVRAGLSQARPERSRGAVRSR
nr:spidroin-1-like [Aegilops tauschii subsp. strangulata]